MEQAPRDEVLEEMQSAIQGRNLRSKLGELLTPTSELEESLLASANYDGDLRVAILKFYDQREKRFWIWRDNTGHKPYCVEADTLLLGDNMTISEIRQGNNVLGRTGEVKVEGKMVRPYHGDMVVVKASGLLPLRVTPEHPILVARSNSRGHGRINGFESPSWRFPTSLTPKKAHSQGDYLLMPVAKPRFKIKSYSLSCYSRMRSGWLKVSNFPINEDTAWLLGVYVAEGSPGGRRGAVFSLNKGERALRNRIRRVARTIGYGCCTSKNGPNSVNTHVGGVVLARAFNDWCGQGADNKKIPDFVLFHSNLRILRSFLKGYTAGDGSNGLTTRKNYVSLSQQMTSTSRLLALQIQQAYARLGVFAGIKTQHEEGDCVIQGRKVHQAKAYTISFVFHPRHTRARLVGDAFYLPVREVGKASFHGTVYNIQTADGTYLVNNAVVHNCYTRLPMEELQEIRARKDVIEIGEENKLDLLNDTRATVRKIITTDPLAIGGGTDSIRDKIKAWEADIKYYENYAYDRGLRMGTYYRISHGEVQAVKHEPPPRVAKSLEEILKRNPPEFMPYLKEWAELLGEPLADFKRVALDIEVANELSRLPDPEDPKQPVIAVSFYNDAEKLVFVLKSGKEVENLGSEAMQVVAFDDETELLRAVLDKIMDYPVVVTFNGDDFDLRYLKHRAEAKGIAEDENPIQLERVAATLKHGVHIDLYQFFRNRSIQVYAFSNKYTEHTLNGVCEALLNKSKVEFEGEIGDLPLAELANYCLNDAQLTYELTAMGGSVVMKLLLVISRIGKMPMNDVSRLGVSNWIRSMLFFEHRKLGALIPRQDELAEKGGATSQAIIKGKKYKGGLVIDPKPGVFFDVSVLDFASLYPSLIKVHNLSYETVNCPHEECRSNKVPDTSSWVCTRRKGITSLVTGSLRDLRVSHYKPLTKDSSLPAEDRELYGVVTQGLKVFLNATYGAMGFETFAFYCLPVAEATAALGRDAITRTIDRCKELGIEVLYGDTDSIFLRNPSKEQISTVTRWADTDLGIELDLDKAYRYIAFSSRKKNYFGVLPDGTVEIRGLTGKKSQTPEYLKETFYKALDILSKVQTQEDFERARANTRELLTGMITSLKNRKVPVEKLAFNVMMGKPTGKYDGTTPQHVRAARLLEEKGREIKAGEIISYVKTKNPPYVKPVELARVEDVDADKYMEYARSMFDQMLDALDFSFDEIMGATTLDFFWSG